MNKMKLVIAALSTIVIVSCAPAPSDTVNLKTDEFNELIPFVESNSLPSDIVGMWQKRIGPGDATGSGEALLFKKDGTMLNKAFLNDSDLNLMRDANMLSREGERFARNSVNSAPIRNKYRYEAAPENRASG